MTAKVQTICDHQAKCTCMLGLIQKVEVPCNKVIRLNSLRFLPESSYFVCHNCNSDCFVYHHHIIFNVFCVLECCYSSYFWCFGILSDDNTPGHAHFLTRQSHPRVVWQIFSAMTECKQELGISDWGISSATLEETFICLCKHAVGV